MSWRRGSPWVVDASDVATEGAPLKVENRFDALLDATYRGFASVSFNNEVLEFPSEECKRVVGSKESPWDERDNVHLEP